MNAGNMMNNAGSMNVNNQMAGGMQMQGNNPMGGNVSTPNMSAMNTGPMSANPMGSNTSLASPASAVSSPIPHMGNMNNLGSPLQPGMAMKPGAQTPPANVLQVVKEVQEEAARQGCGSFGKNLPVTGSMPPPAAMQRGMNVNMGIQQQNTMIPQQQQQPSQQVFYLNLIKKNGIFKESFLIHEIIGSILLKLETLLLLKKLYFCSSLRIIFKFADFVDLYFSRFFIQLFDKNSNKILFIKIAKSTTIATTGPTNDGECKSTAEPNECWKRWKCWTKW